MSASMIVVALTLGAAQVIPQTLGTGATVTVRGFVPASCRVSPAAAVGCNTAVVKRTTVGRAGNPTSVLVSPLI